MRIVPLCSVLIFALSYFIFPSSSFAQCQNNLTPIADAAEPVSGAAGVAVSFNASASHDANGTISAYAWSFGDGSTLVFQPNAIVQHVYVNPGTYTAICWVRDNCNAMSIPGDSVTVTISGSGPTNQAPVVNAGADQTITLPASANLVGSYNDDGLPTGGVITRTWSKVSGPGNVSFANASSLSTSASFSVAGSYVLKLTVSDGAASSGGLSGFDNVSITVNPASNPCGNNQPPVANAGSDRSGQVIQAIAFSGSSSTDPNGNATINSFWWNFGDGQFTGWQSNGNVNHSYAAVGNYSARLWVRDTCGAMSVSDTAIITISNAPNPCNGNQPPVANAGPDKSGNVGQSISFSGSGSSDPQGNATISSYSWNFGDGQTGNGVSVSHSYASAGSYTVTLTVTDNCNATHSDIASVTITPVNPCAGNTAPIANAGPDKSGQVGQSISFSGSGSVDLNGNATIVSYAWNFGDGQTANGVNVSHSYASPGNYTATLTVTDNCNATHSDLASVIVSPPAGNLVADFQVLQLTHVDLSTGAETWEPVGLSPDDPIESNLRVKLDGTVSQGPIAEYEWYKNGAIFATSPTVIRSYIGPAQITISLTVATAGWTQYTEVTKTLFIGESMQILGAASAPPYSSSGSTRAGLFVQGSTAWIAKTNGPTGSLIPVNFSNPNSPTIGQATSLSQTMLDVVGRDDLLVVAGMSDGILIFQQSPGPMATLVGQFNMGLYDGSYARSSVIQGNYLYVSCVINLKVFNLSNPSTPQLVNTIPTPEGTSEAIILSGNRLYVGCQGSPGIFAFDVTNPQTPVEISFTPTAEVPTDFAVNGSVLAVTEWGGFYPTGPTNLSLFRILPDGDIVLLSRFLQQPNNSYYSVAITDQFAYVATGSRISKFCVVRPEEPYLLYSRVMLWAPSFKVRLSPFGLSVAMGAGGVFASLSD